MRNGGGVAASTAAALLALVPLASAADGTPVVAMLPRLRLLSFADALTDHQTTVINERTRHRDGLNGGEIAGIVIGSVAALLLLLGVIALAVVLSRPAKAKKGTVPATCEGTKTWGPHSGGWTSMWSFAAPSAPPPPPPLPMHCPPGGGGNPCPPGFVPAPCPPPRVAKPGSSIWRVPFRPPFGSGRTGGGGGGCGGRSCGLAPCVCCVVCFTSPCRCMMGGMRCGTCRQGRGKCRCGGRGGGGSAPRSPARLAGWPPAPVPTAGGEVWWAGGGGPLARGWSRAPPLTMRRAPLRLLFALVVSVFVFASSPMPPRCMYR